MTQDAFLNILLPLQPAMQLMAEKMLHSAADAEDTVQDVFMELWERRDRLKQVVNLEAYAMQTIRYRCVSTLRKRKEIVPDTLEDLCDEDIANEVALTDERAARLDHAMLQLSERQRKAVKLKYIDGLSHEEIQRQMGMSSTHVYATLSRALGTLKQMVRK